MQDLEGSVQHYLWGDERRIPEFLGRPADGRPWAEVWYGAHPLAPSRLADGRSLDEAIRQEPGEILGASVGSAFPERLPYLMKIISAAKPLSLQVHPTREHAAESFVAENAANLPLGSPSRNYRDDNHKPELLIALSDFTALCGFRTPRRAAALLEGLGDGIAQRLHTLLMDSPTAHGMRAAVRALLAPTMRPPEAEIHEVVRACADRLRAGRSPSPRVDRIVATLAEHHPDDPGVIAALLLNPVSLRPNEAMFVPAGALHSYISGTGLEVMAASDNVLRAGLTSKRVDVEELLACVSVLAAPPVRVAPEHLSEATVAYYAPVDDFELSLTRLNGQSPSGQGEALVPGTGPRIVLCLEGAVTLQTSTGSRGIRRGEAVLVPAADGTLRASGSGRFVQACVP